tara:strand:- start:497 stop:709 length:213 start_codon:yes stop_codon:yes gene_type:complete
MKLVDNRNRKINIGDKVRIEKDIPSVNGMLYKNTIVKIDDHNQLENRIKVTDTLGKIWWVTTNDVSSSYL